MSALTGGRAALVHSQPILSQPRRQMTKVKIRETLTTQEVQRLLSAVDNYHQRLARFIANDKFLAKPPNKRGQYVKREVP